MPSVVSINRTDSDPSNPGTVHFTVTFSENVYGVGSGDFALAATGLTGFSIADVSASGVGPLVNAVYTVTVNTGSVSGTGTHTLGLNLVDNDSIKDIDEVPLGGSGIGAGMAGDGGFTGQVYTINADSTPPDTSITAQPANPTNQTSATFSFTGSDDLTPAGSLTFECSLDAVAFASCVSPKSYAGPLSAGSRNFQVRAKDAAGNTDPTPASYTWTIDTTAPDTSIIAQPANPTNQTTASFSFTGSDNVTPAGSLTFQCKLDGGSFTACTSPQGYSSLAEGSHTFQVEATDQAGNTDASPASSTWVVDTTPPPAPSITSNPSNPTNQTTASFGFTDSEGGVTFLCSLGGGAYAACTSPQSYSGLSEGSHTFAVKAIDAAGNASSATSFLGATAQ